MGVYIKGMEMPTRCGRCDMCVKEVDGDIDYHYECCITAARIDNLGDKMEDCPLVPVPPHGRLIDADALGMNYLRIRDDGMKIYTQHAIDNAPTILEAEEGE